MQQDSDNNPFRQYAFARYQQPGVADQLLHLQDHYGLNVNLLLFMAWLGQCRQRVDAAFIKTCVLQIQTLDKTIIQPLREVRRNIRQQLGDDEHYRQAKALELSLETLVLDKLYQQAVTTPPPAVGEFCMADNVHDYCNRERSGHIDQQLLQKLDFYCLNGLA